MLKWIGWRNASNDVPSARTSIAYEFSTSFDILSHFRSVFDSKTGKKTTKLHPFRRMKSMPVNLLSIKKFFFVCECRDFLLVRFSIKLSKTRHFNKQPNKFGYQKRLNKFPSKKKRKRKQQQKRKNSTYGFRLQHGKVYTSTSHSRLCAWDTYKMNVLDE